MTAHETRPAKPWSHQSPSNSYKIDTVDLKILSILQNEGRLANVDLAKRIGVSPSVALRRTTNLENCEIIRGSHAALHAKKLGYDLTAFVTVYLGALIHSDVLAFEADMQSLSAIRECHALVGHRDFLLRCVFHDVSELNAFLHRVLLADRRVSSAKCFLVIGGIKEEPLLPLEVVEAKLAPSDLRKLKELAKHRVS